METKCVECLNARMHQMDSGEVFAITTVEPARYIFRGVSYCESHAEAAIRDERTLKARYSVLYDDGTVGSPSHVDWEKL